MEKKGLLEELHRKMIEEIQDYEIILLDLDGTILTWNKGVEKIKGYKDHEILYNGIFSVLYFGVKNYNKSGYWLNQVINNNATSFREDVMSTSILFNLILHYEKGNDDLLDYLVRGAYRYFYRKNKLYKFENVILDFIRKKLFKANTKEKLLTTFKSLRKELYVLSKDPYESKAMELFDFIAWLDSKINNKPLAEMMQIRLRN